jgi:hypothetical protein
MLDSGATDGAFSVVEYRLSAKEFGAPLHLHSREDEFTVVTAGRVGFHAGPGDLIRKPRDQWHTFWNAGHEPARALELISPVGFERYFEEIGPFFPDGAEPDIDGMAQVNEKYGLQMAFDSLPQLIERFGLVRPAEMGGVNPA